MSRILLVLIAMLLLSCKERTDNTSSISKECINWNRSCNLYHEIEYSFEQAWAKKDTVRLLRMVNSMYDSELDDEQFLDRFMVMAGSTGVLPLGSYELCDSCWIKTLPLKQKKRYKKMIVDVYREYIKIGEYYPKDTAHQYSIFVNTKYDVELDSGLFTPKQYLDTLDYFITNRIQVDLGG